MTKFQDPKMFFGPKAEAKFWPPEWEFEKALEILKHVPHSGPTSQILERATEELERTEE